ncbi:MAG: mechanosensitive ion channel [Synechococcales cyanobacterium RM1_1_8]|nr:mechanosensitive ion channel [Synechococcales cyanobacterium RM1_1_8]
MLLQLWGIDLSSLTILASALGVGIGFGFQDIAKNFGSGLVLVFERPIQVGDFVEVGGYSGTIERLGARSTMIRTLDNLDIFIPNSRFLEEEVTNWSHNRTPTRVKVPVGVAYGSDLKAVEEALLESAQSNKNVLKMPEPAVFFTGFGDSALDFTLMVWIARPQQHVRIKSELNFKIDAAFRRRQIEIPFPQRDLHVRSGKLPVELLPGSTMSPGDGGASAAQE